MIVWITDLIGCQWLATWSADYQVYWLTECQWLAGWPAHWQSSWQNERHVSRLTGWLSYKYNAIFSCEPHVFYLSVPFSFHSASRNGQIALHLLSLYSLVFLVFTYLLSTWEFYVLYVRLFLCHPPCSSFLSLKILSSSHPFHHYTQELDNRKGTTIILRRCTLHKRQWRHDIIILASEASSNISH
jgi:hypothetical protein